MAYERIIRKSIKTVDALMRKNGYRVVNTIKNPSGYIVEYKGSMDSMLIVFNEKGKAENIM